MVRVVTRSRCYAVMVPVSDINSVDGWVVVLVSNTNSVDCSRCYAVMVLSSDSLTLTQ